MFPSFKDWQKLPYFYRIYSTLDNDRNSLRSRNPSKFKWHSWHVEADNVGWPRFTGWWSEGRDVDKRNFICWDQIRYHSRAHMPLMDIYIYIYIIISEIITLLLLCEEYSSRTLGDCRYRSSSVRHPALSGRGIVYVDQKEGFQMHVPSKSTVLERVNTTAMEKKSARIFGKTKALFVMRH